MDILDNGGNMKRNRLLITALALLLLTGGLAGAQKVIPSPRQAPRLVPGQNIEGLVRVTLDERSAQRYRLSIPEDAYAVNFELTRAPADLDLLLYDASGELVAFSENDDFIETLMLTRYQDPFLETGQYELEVAYQWHQYPIYRGKAQEEIPFSLKMDLVTVQEATRLPTNGQVIRSRLEPSRGMMQVFEITVPRGVREIRVDLSDNDGDLDLFGFLGGVYADPYYADYFSNSGGSLEWLLLNPVQDATATYGIMVISSLDLAPQDFSIQAKLGSGAPASLTSFPAIPTNRGGLDLALLATVEVIDDFGGGSGVIMTPDGWVITNYHVVANSWQDDRPVILAMSLDHRKVPRELFSARIVDVSVDADLALLKIEAGVYGQALPEDLWLPAIQIADDRQLWMGQSLRFIGYPLIGSLGTRTTITLTQGLVSGFENRGFGTVIKTDGEINSGNSGGAAVLLDGALVGFPTRIVWEGGGQLAYVHPLSAVPQEWWTRMGRRFP